MIGFVLLAVALTSIFYNWFLKRTNVESLAIGALSWWFILMILTTLLMPGSSYLFTWPLLFTVVAMGIVFISKDERSISWKGFAVTAAAIPAILIFAPMIYLVFTALALWRAGIIMVLVTLSIGVLLAQLQIIATPRKSLLAGVMLMASLGFFVAGIVSSGFGASHPQSDWSNATMDSMEAMDQIERMFLTDKGSEWLPPWSFDFWIIPYLLGKGVSLESFRNFMMPANKMLALEIARTPEREKIALQGKYNKRWLRRCA